MYLTYERHMCNTVIAGKTGDAKYRIYSSKTENTTNITIHKTTEGLKSNKILEGSDDEGEINLLLNIPSPPFEICHIKQSLSSVKLM